MTHTPGPWIVSEHRGVWAGPVVKAGQTGVAFIVGEHEANARLIAAAPELLNACRELLAIVEGEYNADPSREPMDAWRSAIQSAVSVLAKAEGRTHEE